MRHANTVDVVELAAAPANPPAGREVLYALSNGLFYKNSAGTITGPLAAAGGGGATSFASANKFATD